MSCVCTRPIFLRLATRGKPSGYDCYGTEMAASSRHFSVMNNIFMRFPITLRPGAFGTRRRGQSQLSGSRRARNTLCSHVSSPRYTTHMCTDDSMAMFSHYKTLSVGKYDIQQCRLLHTTSTKLATSVQIQRTAISLEQQFAFRLVQIVLRAFFERDLPIPSTRHRAPKVDDPEARLLHCALRARHVERAWLDNHVAHVHRPIRESCLMHAFDEREALFPEGHI